MKGRFLGLLVETDAGDVDFAATYGPRNAAGDAYIYSTRRVWRVFSLLAPDATAASLEKTPMDYLGSELPWAIEVEKDITIEDVLALNRDHYEGSRFDYLTIRGSGHMVPEFKPSQTLAWLTAWLHKEDWKPYVPAKP